MAAADSNDEIDQCIKDCNDEALTLRLLAKRLG